MCCCFLRNKNWARNYNRRPLCCKKKLYISCLKMWVGGIMGRRTLYKRKYGMYTHNTLAEPEECC